MAKLSLDEIKAMHQIALEAADKALFEDKFHLHGWSAEEYCEAILTEAESVLHYEMHIQDAIKSGTYYLN
jgi:hypothetical protein